MTIGSVSGGESGTVRLAVRVLQWLRAVERELRGKTATGDGIARARWCGFGGQWMFWVHSPRATLVHVPQLAAVLTPLERVGAVYWRLVTV